MSAVVIPFPGKPEPAPDKPQHTLTRAQFRKRADMLRRLAEEWGLSITIHRPAGEAAARRWPKDIFPPGRHPRDYHGPSSPDDPVADGAA